METKLSREIYMWPMLFFFHILSHTFTDNPKHFSQQRKGSSRNLHTLIFPCSGIARLLYRLLLAQKTSIDYSQ